MKKTMVIFLITVVLISVFCSCSSVVPKTTFTEDNSNIDIGNIEDYITLFDSKTMLEFENILKTHSGYSEEFKDKSYFSDEAKQKINIEILGKTYVGIYYETHESPYENRVIDQYNLEGTEKGSVFIERKNNKISKYLAIPYEKESLKIRQDYIEVITNLLKNEEKLSEYDFQMDGTAYSIKTDDAVEGTFIESFKEKFDSNESFTYYDFYYEKRLEEAALPDHISVKFFYDGTFDMEIYASEYSKEDYQHIVDDAKTIEKSAENYIKENVREDITILSIAHDRQRLFVMDGEFHSKITSVVTFTTTTNKTPYSFVVTTITTKKSG